MRHYLPQILPVVCLPLFLSACVHNEPVVGRCGEYQRVNGTAVIAEIKPVNSTFCANQGREVYFRFMPVPGAKDPRPEINQSIRLETANVSIFPLPWLNANNWQVGTHHRMEKHVAMGGVCAPFVFETAEITEKDVPVIRDVCNAAPVQGQ